MGEGSARQAVGVLVTAFRQEQVSEATVELYVAKLSDIAEPLLAATVSKIVDTSRFFPSIAEIRLTAAQLAGILPPSPEEALGIIRRADVEEPVYDRGDPPQLAYVERHWEWPEGTPRATVEFIRQALAKVGDPVTKDGKRAFGWEQDFKATYEIEASVATQLALADLSKAALPAPRVKVLPAPEAELPIAEVQDNLERVRGIVGTLAQEKSLPI